MHTPHTAPHCLRPALDRAAARWTRRLCRWSLLVLVACLVLTRPAAARMDDDLAKWYSQFNLQTNNAGAYESQRRGYFNGGALQLRVPMEQWQLLSADPPRFGAGCNGVDLHFGGLSFVSFDRYVQLLSQLGTGAVAGFAFELATCQLSQQICQTLKSLEAVARQINSLANIQPCQQGLALGRELAKTLKGDASADLSQPFQQQKAALGQIQDTLAGRDVLASQSPKEATASLKQDPAQDPTGDVVYLTLNSAGLTDDQITLVRAVTGSVYVDDNGQFQALPATLRLSDLQYAIDGYPYAVWACTNPPSCTQNSLVSRTDLKGFYWRAAGQLTRIATAVLTNQVLQYQDQQFLEKFPIPALRLIGMQRTNAPAMQQVVASLASIGSSLMVRDFLSQVLTQMNAVIPRIRQLKPGWAGAYTVLTASVTELQQRVHADLQTATAALIAEEKTLSLGREKSQKFLIKR